MSHYTHSNDPYINRIIFSKYLIQRQIGKGSFGTVYQGIINDSQEKIAVKIERRERNSNGTLELEAYRLIYLQGEGIPKIYCYGNNQTHNILVQELLGKSLEYIFNHCDKKFSLKCVCALGIEMIKRIQFVHSKYHVHRDIKPDNFMIGRDEHENDIYIIDFGLAKKYYSVSKHTHIKYCEGKSLIGTARYCGRNAHRGCEQGRRDDIESIGYVLMYFLIGSLPWQGLKVRKGEDQFQKIAEKKYNTSFEELTRGQPEEFLKYFQHVDELKFEDKPDYDYLIGLFQSVINKHCNDCFYDFDWQRNSSFTHLSEEQYKQEQKGRERDVSLIVNNKSFYESKNEYDEIKEGKDNVFLGEDKESSKYNGSKVHENKERKRSSSAINVKGEYVHKSYSKLKSNRSKKTESHAGSKYGEQYDKNYNNENENTNGEFDNNQNRKNKNIEQGEEEDYNNNKFKQNRASVQVFTDQDNNDHRILGSNRLGVNGISSDKNISDSYVNKSNRRRSIGMNSKEYPLNSKNNNLKVTNFNKSDSDNDDNMDNAENNNKNYDRNIHSFHRQSRGDNNYLQQKNEGDRKKITIFGYDDNDDYNQNHNNNKYKNNNDNNFDNKNSIHFEDEENTFGKSSKKKKKLYRNRSVDNKYTENNPKCQCLIY